MTTLLEALRRLRERNQPNPQPLIFLAHPAHAETPEGMGYLLGIQANGMEVHIAPTVCGPTFTLDEWIAHQGAPVCGNCDTRLPGGCGGLFSDEAPCRWKPHCIVCGTDRGVKLGRGDGKWRCQNAECT